MKNWILALTGLLALSASVISSLAFAGGESGGGEPDAIEFISLGHKVVNWVDRHPNPAFTKQEVEYVLYQLEEHLNSDQQDQLLVFTESEVSCELGSGPIPKAGCTNAKGILINRRSWDSSSAKQKLSLVLLELLKLMEKDHRYETAQAIARNSEKILALSDQASSGTPEPRPSAGGLSHRSLTFTVGQDLVIEPGKDVLIFFEGKVVQGSAGSLMEEMPEKKFGPQAQFKEAGQTLYRTCLISLEHTRGGTLRKGRVFRSVLGAEETDGRRLYATIEGLGLLICENVQSPESFRRYKALNAEFNTETHTMTLANIAPYFGRYFRITADAAKAVSPAQEF